MRKRRTNDERLALQLAMILWAHEHQPVTVAEVAAHFGYSARSLSRLFQKNIETSFLQYVKLTRIIKSIELLLKTDLSISEVAYASGYNSLSAFSYAFNQIVNQSPAAFKKQSL